MDPWTNLRTLLANSLYRDNDLAQALSSASHAPTGRPHDLGKDFVDRLTLAMATTSDARVLEFGAQVKKKLQGRGATAQSTRLTWEVAQDLDGQDAGVSWWQLFGTLTRSTAASESSVGRVPYDVTAVLAVGEHTLEDTARTTNANAVAYLDSEPIVAQLGNEQESFLEVFSALPVKRHRGLEHCAAGCLETFKPLQSASAVRSGGAQGRSAKARKSNKSQAASPPGFAWAPFIHRGPGGAISAQSQGLLTAMHQRIHPLPESVRDAIRPHMKPVGRTEGVGFASKVVSWLSGLSTRTVDNTVSHDNKKGPCKRPILKRKRETVGGAETAIDEIDQNSEKTESVQHAGDAVDVGSSVAESPKPSYPTGFINLLRVCAVVSSHAIPNSTLPAIAHALIEARGDVGQSYVHRKFVKAFDTAVYNVCTSQLRSFLQRPMGGTGLPPEVELIGDGVSCGKYFGRASASLLVCGVIISAPSPPYAAEIFLGAESQGMDERAPAQMDRMSKIVQRSTAIDVVRFLRTRTASTCGDGQMCRGGEKAEHNSGASMNRLWTDVAKTGEENASWDSFHLFNAAGSGALMQSECGQKYCDVLKRQEHLFALGQGKELRQSLAEYMVVSL